MPAAELTTPYYLIDEAKLRHNLETVNTIRARSGAKAVLALKCFATWSTFDIMRDYLDGTTSSSLYEAQLGHEEFGKEVHAYSVAFSADDIRALQPCASKIIFNSISQLESLRPLTGDVPLGLRVNPSISYSHYDLADPARRFSRLGVVDVADVMRVLPQLSGLMFHFNCENTDVDQLSHAIDLISQRYADALHQVQWVSLGGGIAFNSEGYALDQLCTRLKQLAEDFGVQVYLEPGDTLVTGCTELVATVLDVVHNEREIAIVDSSLEAHMLDHLIYQTNPKLNAPAAGTHEVMIAGKTCLAGDVFGTYSLERPLQVGDQIHVADAAGYTMVKTNWFNGLQMPAIAIRGLDGQIRLVRRFNYTDFKRNLS
ncbi:MAG: carboxynorspermidine decarboxylase [Pseudomonadota bacterium]|nr:carboxynorspermidine decarboxylase [Pseudomonadota bacterium]